MKMPAGTRAIAELFGDLTEPVRLRILRVLEREELSVGEVASVVQLPQSTVSRHLKVLADGGWVVRRAEGTATLYRLVLDDLGPAARAVWMAAREQLAPRAGERAGEHPELAEDSRRLAAVLAERMTDSQSYFGRVAGEWDDVRNELFGDRFTTRALLSFVPREWTVIDLGCGTGNASELLAPVVKRVIAVDQSAPMLKAAKKRLGAFGNVDLVRGDVSALPLADACADAAVGVLVLHHLDDPGGACREVRRVLREGGVVLVIDMMAHDRTSYRHTMGHRWLGFDAGQMAGLLGGAGFRDVRFSVLPSDTAARGPGLFACSAFAGAE